MIIYIKQGRNSLLTIKRNNTIKYWCTFSPDDPKTSMELNCSVEVRMAKGAISIRSLFAEFLLHGNFLLRVIIRNIFKARSKLVANNKKK